MYFGDTPQPFRSYPPRGVSNKITFGYKFIISLLNFLLLSKNDAILNLIAKNAVTYFSHLTLETKAISVNKLMKLFTYIPQQSIIIFTIRNK